HVGEKFAFGAVGGFGSFFGFSKLFLSQCASGDVLYLYHISEYRLPIIHQGRNQSVYIHDSAFGCGKEVKLPYRFEIIDGFKPDCLTHKNLFFMLSHKIRVVKQF
ncbi:MAG TPA: hypothetical protein DCQ37_10875, partial [Desulfobacteraceae bacterium]|nr:hypothetical protein [Desulfobacteraceae bacterium]